ncbi:hypothetical protein J6590_052798 [Homalodisca vitripennis]|nr:hypothetical protein J6590_052798 [Homalodisca vitripennis]
MSPVFSEVIDVNVRSNPRITNPTYLGQELRGSTQQWHHQDLSPRKNIHPTRITLKASRQNLLKALIQHTIVLDHLHH